MIYYESVVNIILFFCLFKKHFKIYIYIYIIIHHAKEHEVLRVIHFLRFYLFKISP